MSGLVIVKPVTETTVRNPQRALLPGRTAWIELCHARPAACRECMGRIARFLAAEMEWSLRAALDRPAESYRAELGVDKCTLVQAAELRRLTCAWCYTRTEMQEAARRFSSDPIVAESYAASEPATSRSLRDDKPKERWMPLEREILRFRLGWLLVVILILLAVA